MWGRLALIAALALSVQPGRARDGYREYDYRHDLAMTGCLGVGVEWTGGYDGYRIVDFYPPDWPHDGLAVGDQIVAVDGVSVASVEFAKFFKRLYGRPGQSAVLTFLAKADRSRHEVTLTRLDRRQAIAGAAAAGDSAAQLWMGRYCLENPPKAPQFAEGLEWLEKASSQGNASATGWLGSVYRDGLGVPPDPVKAAIYFRASAERGDAGSQEQLARLYENGFGVPKDSKVAQDWYLKAAQGGDTDAMERLSQAYADGVFLPQDGLKAWYWRTKAESETHGEEEFDTALELLASDHPAVRAWGRQWLEIACEFKYPPAMRLSLSLHQRDGNAVAALRDWQAWMQMPGTAPRDVIRSAQSLILTAGPIVQVLWVVILPSLAAFLGISAGFWCVSGPFLRLPADAPWHERARRAWPCRNCAGGSLFVCLLLPILPVVFADPDYLPFPWAVVFTFTVLATLLGGLTAFARIRARLLGRRYRFVDMARGTVAYLPRWVGYIFPWLLLVSLPVLKDGPGIVLALVLTIAVNLWLEVTAGLPIYRLFGLVIRPSKKLVELSAVVAGRLGTHPRPAVLLRWKTPRLFTIPGAQTVAISTRLAEILTDDEFLAVLVREYWFLDEPPRQTRARLLFKTVGSLAMLMIVAGAMNRVALLAIIGILGYVIFYFLVRSTFWQEEHLALHAVKLFENHPGDHLRAAQAIYQDTLTPVVIHPPSRHPQWELYDGLVAGDLTPDYPRPPPPRMGWSNTVFLLLAFVMAISVAAIVFGAPRLLVRLEQTLPPAVPSALKE